MSNVGQIGVSDISLNSLVFTKDSAAIKHLIACDQGMAGLIETVGEYSLALRTDYYQSLARAIIGQQLSLKAAATIWGRTKDLCGSITPESIAAQPDERLRAVGISAAKVRSIKDLTAKVLSGDVRFETIDALEDEGVIEVLTKVKGIGRWTAEMFMIFSLGRPDVFSAVDAGLMRAMRWLYRLEDVAPEVLREISGRWQPYRTAASLYLWEAINRGLVNAETNRDGVRPGR